MTAFSDVLPQMPPPDAPRLRESYRWLIRSAQRFGGAALALAALGLWLQPGALWDTDLVLIKMGLSLALSFAGLAILQASGPPPGRGAEVEIDTVRREVRLVRGKGTSRTLVSRTRMADLGQAEHDGASVRLWGADGALIADLTLNEPASRTSLIRALRDSGKLQAHMS